MAKKRKTSANPARKIEASVSSGELERERKKHEEDLEEARKETEELKKLVRKMQEDNEKIVIDMSKNDQDKIDVTLRANVISTTREVVYPKCPYISTNEHL